MVKKFCLNIVSLFFYTIPMQLNVVSTITNSVCACVLSAGARLRVCMRACLRQCVCVWRGECGVCTYNHDCAAHVCMPACVCLPDGPYENGLR